MTPMTGWLRTILRAPTFLYRWHLGWILGSRFVLLSHTGRRSGRRYQTVLEVIGHRPDGELTVMSGWGRHSDWYRNIQNQPVVEITFGRHTTAATHRELPPPEAIDALAAYERRNRIAGWIVRRTLSALVGWDYDGTPESRHQLLQQLPLVSFRPTTKQRP